MEAVSAGRIGTMLKDEAFKWGSEESAWILTGKDSGLVEGNMKRGKVL